MISFSFRIVLTNALFPGLHTKCGQYQESFHSLVRWKMIILCLLTAELPRVFQGIAAIVVVSNDLTVRSITTVSWVWREGHYHQEILKDERMRQKRNGKPRIGNLMID